MESLPEDDYRRTMPEVEAGYMLSVFFGVGLCSSNGMGATAISWTELCNYCTMTATELTAWEAEQVMLMSRCYVAMLRKADDPNMLPPYTSEEDEEQIAARRQAVVEQMMALKRRRKKAP